VRYIWIGPLCIIQVSIEDWERESTAMSHICKHAYFTIAACGSDSPEGGCLSPRDILKFSMMILGKEDLTLLWCLGVWDSGCLHWSQRQCWKAGECPG
jgi:hypothetical protein